MSNKPHLLLHWVLDIPKQQLICKVNDDLTYIAYNGGHDGFTKIYKGVTSEVTLAEWIPEKLWISEQYGDQVGYYQPDANRVKKHPRNGWDQSCVNGLGPDGEYIDHLQRMQILMEGYDQATVWFRPPYINEPRLKELDIQRLNMMPALHGLIIHNPVPNNPIARVIS